LFITHRTSKTPTIYQDCAAVVSLVTKGGAAARTKHLMARTNFAREAIDEEKIHVEYIHNSTMRADGFSKPFDPKDHTPFAAHIQEGIVKKE
jgi:hypothetical protein